MTQEHKHTYVKGIPSKTIVTHSDGTQTTITYRHIVGGELVENKAKTKVNLETKPKLERKPRVKKAEEKPKKRSLIARILRIK